jgi:hypothetical protein
MLINNQKYTLSATGMEEAELAIYKSLFPYPILDFNEGIKYLGFYLKPNCYIKYNRNWLIAKLEKY